MSCTNMHQIFLHNFFNFLNVCWIYGDIPEEWRTAIVIPIHKKGDRINPDDYRGVSLLNTGYKIYSKIIAKRLTAIAEQKSRTDLGKADPAWTAYFQLHK